MANWLNMKESLISFHRSVKEFPVGAITFDELKPIEERIKEKRQLLKRQNARLLMLKAECSQFDSQLEIEDDLKKRLQDAATSAILAQKIHQLCLHTLHIEHVSKNKATSEDQFNEMDLYMKKLVMLNDKIIAMHQTMEKLLKEQITLKLGCQQALAKYRSFLNNRKNIQSSRLEEENPQEARKKEKTRKLLRKMNIMKKMIMNFIAVSTDLWKNNKDLIEYMEKHRELISLETIQDLASAQRRRET